MAIEESDGWPGPVPQSIERLCKVRPPSDCVHAKNAGANHVRNACLYYADEATPPVRDRRHACCDPARGREQKNAGATGRIEHRTERAPAAGRRFLPRSVQHWIKSRLSSACTNPSGCNSCRSICRRGPWLQPPSAKAENAPLLTQLRCGVREALVDEPSSSVSHVAPVTGTAQSPRSQARRKIAPSNFDWKAATFKARDHVPGKQAASAGRPRRFHHGRVP